MENQKWIKWTSVVVSVLVITSFVVQDRFGMMMPQQKCFAKIDGKPVNPQKFFQILDYQVKMIRQRAPQVSSEDFKMARFPEQVLETYIQKLVKDTELKRQGFVISEASLLQQLQNYGQEFMKNFKYLDPMKKKAILEDIKSGMVEQQLILFYQLPVSYQKALYQSFHSKRMFDLITIDYEKMNVEGQPTAEHLEAIVKKNPQEFMEDEKRSFYLIDLNRKDFPITEAEIHQYYEAHKKQFVSSTTKKLLSLQEAKADVIAHVRHAKLTSFAKELRTKIDEAELNIDDIEGYTPEVFKDVTKDSAFKYSLNVLNFAFGQDLNILSDVFEDPVTGHLYIVQVSDITPEAQMQGEALKKAATQMWFKEKKEDLAKQELNNLFQLESKEAEFYALVKEKKFVLKTDMSIDRTQGPVEGLTPDLGERLFSIGSKQLVYSYTPKGIVIARVKKDVLHSAEDFNGQKTAEYFLRSAFQTVMQLFVNDLLKHHKIERDVEHLYEECHL